MRATVAVIELRPGTTAVAAVDGDDGQVPMLTITDGSVEVMIGPGDPRPGEPASAGAVTFADQLADAAAEYAGRVRKLHQAKEANRT